MTDTTRNPPTSLGSIRLGFVGGGNMAIALLGGLVNRGLDASTALVIEPFASAAATIHARYGVQVAEVPGAALAECDAVVIAVKPQHMRAATVALAAFAPPLVVSIAAGVRIADITRWIGGGAAIVRCMPNTPALIGAGITGLFAGAGVTASQRALAGSLLDAVGATLWVDDEAQLDLVTAISGSGPGYVFYWMEAMHKSAVAQGMSTENARKLVTATFAGASALAQHSEESLKTLRDQVTSKGGTTAAALESMDHAGVAAAIAHAVVAASERARQMGNELGGT